MPSSRLSLRLGQLPHDVLAELAARLCSESPALQAAAEECMATHKPLSHELVERVLLDAVPLGEGGREAARLKPLGWRGPRLRERETAR